MEPWCYDLFVPITGYRQFRQTPYTFRLNKNGNAGPVEALVKAVKLIVPDNCILLTIRIIASYWLYDNVLICTHDFAGSPWRDVYHSLVHAILQVHEMFLEAAIPTIAPCDILWACHAIFLLHERQLKPREHSFVCSRPNHGCGLCPKDWLDITLKLL